MRFALQRADGAGSIMADSVQYALDRMADDLNDLLRRGIFSEVG